MTRAEWRKDHFTAEEISLLEREETEWRQDQSWLKSSPDAHSLEYTVSYDFLHKLWQALGSVPQGVNILCSGVYEKCSAGYQSIEDVFNG